jgi:hypothetical protein
MAAISALRWKAQLQLKAVFSRAASNPKHSRYGRDEIPQALR